MASVIMLDPVGGGSASTPYLTFRSPSVFTVEMDQDYNVTWDGILEYSTDSDTWITWDSTEITAAPSSGSYYLYFRGTGNSIISGDDYNKFIIDGSDIDVIGNIETLLDYQTVLDGNHPVMGDFCYSGLFGSSPIISAPELPAINLTESCYDYMFYYCKHLTTPPELPAITLAPGCYWEMFKESGLIVAPKLPATTLAYRCYNGMFYRCSNLVTVPELPATTMAEECYDSMFAHCTNIKLAEEQGGIFHNEWSIPSGGQGVVPSEATDWNSDMLYGTYGTFRDDPEINTSYYYANPGIASLQSKSTTPSASQQIISSDPYYDGISTVTVYGDANLASGNIKAGISIFNTNGSFTSDADATADDIAIGKTAYVGGVKVTGTGSSSGTKVVSHDNQDGTQNLVITDPASGSTSFVAQAKSVSVNGLVTADAGYDGLSSVDVNVPQGVPIEISTDAGMTAVLTSANVGRVYKFTGTTGTYTNGDMYIVEVG